MKKITTPRVREEAEYYCDSCGVECFTELKFNGWYGSKFDMTQSTIHLCDGCWEKVRVMLKNSFEIDPKQEDILEL